MSCRSHRRRRLGMSATAPNAIRRQINQGFFEKLFIGEDGNVVRAELTEPFRALLGTDRAMMAIPAARTVPGAPSTHQPDGTTIAEAASPVAVLDVIPATTGEHTKAGREILAGQGLNENYLVDLAGAYSNPGPLDATTNGGPGACPRRGCGGSAPTRHAERKRPAPSVSTGHLCVELRGIEPLTFSMRTRRATNCATAPSYFRSRGRTWRTIAGPVGRALPPPGQPAARW